ncbi:hypothetical protein CGCSCA5_v000094 [Colletotrichum siamense]|nr:hypothetical protein CGCSCA5_v000094 [Colletotrichum siamense]KAF4870656.1 hypothetical protein CGCSCA1_v010268 [Colletotrichum siamense]
MTSVLSNPNNQHQQTGSLQIQAQAVMQHAIGTLSSVDHQHKCHRKQEMGIATPTAAARTTPSVIMRERFCHSMFAQNCTRLFQSRSDGPGMRRLILPLLLDR